MLCFPLSFKKQDRKCIKADRIIRDFINAASCGTEKGKERGTEPNYVLGLKHATSMQSNTLQNQQAHTQKNKVMQDLSCRDSGGKACVSHPRGPAGQGRLPAPVCLICQQPRPQPGAEQGPGAGGETGFIFSKTLSMET